MSEDYSLPLGVLFLFWEMHIVLATGPMTFLQIFYVCYVELYDITYRYDSFWHSLNPAVVESQYES